MKIINKLKSCVTALAVCACTTTVLASPYDQSVWNTGQYHNMFFYYGASVDDYATRTRLQEQYDQLIRHGDTSSSVLRSKAPIPDYEVDYNPLTDTTQSYIEDINSSDIRSEGVSYGMMIAVQMNDQITFNRLWRFAKAEMRNSNGTFAWRLSTAAPNYDKMDSNPAPDGEEYFAMALFFAQGRVDRHDWLDTGLNYEAEAQTILDVIRTQLFDSGSHQILFTPAASGNNRFTDPSYHLPAFYELWKRLDDTQTGRDFWAAAHTASRTVQFAAAHSVTGLFPEYANFNPNLPMTVEIATAAGVQSPQREDAPYFFSDSHRMLGNIGMDYMWFTSCCSDLPITTELANAGRLEAEIVQRQYDFFDSRNDVASVTNGPLDTYASGYYLDGSSVKPGNGGGYKAASLVAMNAVGAVTIEPHSAQARSYVHALWDQDVPAGEYRYYDGMLHMLAMLHVSGRFRIYMPLSAGEIFPAFPEFRNLSQMSFRMTNTDQSLQSNPTAYYYFTVENGRTPVVDDINTPNISSLNLENLGGNQWAVRMQYTGVTLDPAESVSQADTFRVRYSDWSTFDSSNDFSAPVGDQAQSADRIAVFNAAGDLIMGSKPKGTYAIRVRARGTSGNEIVKLTVGGTVLATWNLSTNFTDYVVNTNRGGGINVEYINDAPNRDVIVDYAIIGGITHQAEAQSGNSAAYGNGHCGGGQHTEWMHCNGFLGFSAYK